MYCKYDMLFFSKYEQIFLKKTEFFTKKHCFFMVEKAKQKLLLENGKFFFKKEKNSFISLFLREVSPAPLNNGLLSYQ